MTVADRIAAAKPPPQHCVIVGELAVQAVSQLAWRTSGFCRRSRSRSSSRASVLLHTCSATQYGQKMRPPVTAGEALGVEPGEDIMAGVLAPDNDPGHDWLLSAPLVSRSASQRERPGTGSIQKTLSPGRGRNAVFPITGWQRSAWRRGRRLVAANAAIEQATAIRMPGAGAQHADSGADDAWPHGNGAGLRSQHVVRGVDDGP